MALVKTIGKDAHRRETIRLKNRRLGRGGGGAGSVREKHDGSPLINQREKKFKNKKATT